MLLSFRYIFEEVICERGYIEYFKSNIDTERFTIGLDFFPVREINTGRIKMDWMCKPEVIKDLIEKHPYPTTAKLRLCSDVDESLKLFKSIASDI